MSGIEYVIAQLGTALQLANQRINELEAEVARLREQAGKQPPDTVP